MQSLNSLLSRWAGICLLWLLPSLLLAQQPLTQTIRGTVRDIDTQTPLAGATVAIPALKVGTYTDDEGNFRLPNVPLGRHELVVSYLGYESFSLPNVLLTSAKEEVLNADLTESVMQTEAVVIDAHSDKTAPVNELSMVSTRAFSVEETHRYAGTIDDPSRMALSFPGVTTGDDQVSNEIIIRGNSPRYLLWRMEGVEIPSPNHFTDQGASSGSVSMLSANLLATSDFSTGAFPSEYGNALSGVFDIRLRRGNNERREYAFQVGVLGVDFAAEGPFKKGYDGSYLVNYRYSTLAMLNKIGLNVVGDAVPVFQDLSFKLHLPAGKWGTFSVFGMGGLSNIDENQTGLLPDSTEGVLWKDHFYSNLAVAGVDHRILLGRKTVINSTVAYTASDIGYKYEERDAEGAFFEDYREAFYNSTLKVQSILTHKVSARHLLKTGGSFTQLGYDLDAEDYFQEETRWVTTLGDKGNAQVAQGFANWRYRVSERFTVNGGVHMHWFSLNNELSIEPRLSARWQFAPKQALSAGFGVHSRREDPAVYLAKSEDEEGIVTQPNIDLGFSKARHLVLGYDLQINETLHFKAEAYYQDLYNVPVLNDSSFSESILNSTAGYTTQDFVNEGTGKNYGVEFTLEKFFSDNYYFLVTSSLYQSKYTGLDGIEYNTRFNGNFVNNVLVGKEFLVGKNKNNRLGLNLRGIWAGGKRYTPIDEAASIAEGTTVRLWDQRYEALSPAYFRTDLSVSYTMNRKKTTHTLKLEIQNATNATNVVNRYYDPRQEQFVDDVRGSLIPVLSYKVQF